VRIAGQDWLVDQPDPGGAVVLDGSVRVAVNPLRIHVISAGGSPPATDLTDGVVSESAGGATHLPSGA
jgi:hypothetical protein